MEKLNRIVKQFIDDYEIKDFSEFAFITNLLSIIDNYNYNLKIVVAKKKISLNKSFKYSYDFLKTIDSKYSKYLLEAKSKKIFHIGKESYSNWENNEKYISLFLQNNINDTYSITHELIHATSINGDQVTLTRCLFCEVFSILGELLQQDFFSKTSKPKDYSLNNKAILNGIICKKDIIFFEMEIIRTYLENGYITEIELINILSKYNKKNFNEVANHFYSIMENEELTYGFEQRYIIGYLISCYMHDHILENSKNINEFIELNDNINYFEIYDVLDYLNLEYEKNTILNLTKESYEKLNKSFIKELKRR